jgi:ATP/maltotriose-dependent transcriptional regulator MalT/DNA-binding SARP family transcriptional activator
MSYAKMLPPVLPSLFKRTRLFGMLDQFRDRQAVWIQGQAGAGKTTLVASYIKQCGIKPLWYRMDAGDDDPATFFHYFSLAAEDLLSVQHRPQAKLTPESLLNPMPFARLFFRELFAGLAKPVVLVFDNFQALAPDSPLNEIIAAALSEIPREMNAILISRCPPPASLSRLQFNRTLALLDQSALRFTDDELLGLSRLWLRGDIQVETIRRMNELADGWVAGLVLLLERGGYDDSATGIGKEYFFSYFASEIFDALDAGRRRFLLHTAGLNTITPAVARELTGVPEAHAILEDLCERHHFTSRCDQAEPVYQYHPLFRDFLLSRGREVLGDEGCRRITARAAHILAGVGETEEAISLAIAAADWPLLSRLINRQAPVMLAQQRFQLLAQWLKQLPPEALESSPWLRYWFGCCRCPFDQRESGSHFGLAYAGFKAQQERDGMLLSAGGAILAIMTEWDDFRSLDPWIAALDELVGETPAYPSANAEAITVLAMLGALLFRMPRHPAMGRWEEHAGRLIRENGADISLRIDIGNVLVHWQYWKGDLAAATHTADILAQLVDAGGSAALPRLFSVMNNAIYEWHIGDFDQSLASIDGGLALAAETGIHVMDDRLMAQSVYASLSRDDLRTAGRFLDRMKPIVQNGRRLAMSHYHYLRSNYHLIAGDLEMARQHGQMAVDINREVGAPFPEALAGFTLAQIHFEMGDHESAANLLANGRLMARDIRSRTLALLYELISAWFKHQQRQDEAALFHLRRGLTLQRKMGFLNIPGWRSSLMKPLLLKALEHDIETEFAQRLIIIHGLRTEAPPQASGKWPWPVKIYTLGRFSLLIDGQPLQFGGKAQQKPLELLKALIALGGREVSKDRLMNILWPDTDGDKAARALDTTLHRFRKLVGYEQAIQVRERKLLLNARFCWVDIWAMERLLGQTQALLGQPFRDFEQEVKLKQQLISLYKGGFLSDDDEPACIVGYRERLNNRYLNTLCLLGSHWEKHLQWNQASNLYQQVLEKDDRQELIHQRLIACYRSQGRIAEAIAAYERCRRTLFTHYGVPPSAETESLYQSLR